MSIAAFPLYKLENVADSLRQLANKIEAGDIDAVRVLVISEGGDGDSASVQYRAFGPEPFTPFHALGLCVVAQDLILREGT